VNVLSTSKTKNAMGMKFVSKPDAGPPPPPKDEEIVVNGNDIAKFMLIASFTLSPPTSHASLVHSLIGVQMVVLLAMTFISLRNKIKQWMSVALIITRSLIFPL